MTGWFDGFPDSGLCSLEIDGPREARSVEEAWQLLPASGEGWVCLLVEIRPFEPGRRQGAILHAEVAAAEGVTTILRHEEGVWRAWTWREKEGTTHRVVRRSYLSSAPAPHGRAPNLRYATYWVKEKDDGVSVWRPVGSRFCGWEEQP